MIPGQQTASNDEGDGTAVGTAVATARPLRLPDIDRMLEKTAGIEHAGPADPVLAWRDELTQALESLNRAEAVLAADVEILSLSLTSRAPESKSDAGGDGTSARSEAEVAASMQAEWGERDLATRLSPLTSAHQQMAHTNLRSKAETKRVLRSILEQLGNLAVRREAVEIRLAQAEASIVRQHREVEAAVAALAPPLEGAQMVTALPDVAALEIDTPVPLGADLGTMVRRGLKWAFAGAFAVRFGTFLTGLILARILSPRDFGVYAVAFVALLVTASVNDIGIEATLVRWPGELDEIAADGDNHRAGLQHCTVCCLLVRCACFRQCVQHSGWGRGHPADVRRSDHQRSVHGELRYDQPHTSGARSEFRRDRSDGGVSLHDAVLAKAGFGAYSLAWGNIGGNLVIGMVLLIWAPIRYRPGFHLPTARVLLRHGLPLAGGGLVFVAMLNTDNVVVGHFLGPVELGFYSLAWNVSSWPVVIFSGAVSMVSLSGFAKLQHDRDELSRAFATSVGALVAITLPFCVLLATLSLPIIHVLYGEKWSHSATALTFLAVLAAMRVITIITTEVLVAVGRGRTVLGLQSFWFAALIPTLIVGAHLGGIAGVGLGHVMVAGALVLPAFAWALHRNSFSLQLIGRAVALPAAGALGIAIVATVIAHLSLPDIVRSVSGRAP